jgi:hypothetical protein
MHKYVVEHWRAGECVQRLVFTEDMIQRQLDGSVIIHFPPHNPVIGLTIVTEDELHVSERDE